MALNEFGAGFKIWAKDFASGVFGQVGKNFSDMSKQAESDANRMSAGLARIGKGVSMLGAGFAIIKPMEIAVRESSKLNAALAEVSTLTDEATFPMGQMKDLVKSTAEQFGQGSTLQAKALYQTISAGYGEAETAAKMLKTANKLAVGGVTEVETAVDGLTNIMNTYSKANLDATDVSDAMFVAMKEGKTTIGEISSKIGAVAPGAEAMGIAFDEVLGTIAAVTSKGIDTSATVSGMAAALGNINKPTNDAKTEAKRLGIEFSAAALRAKGLSGFLDGITKSAKYNDDTMSKLFGSIEAFKVMTALSSNESAKFNDVMSKMRERAGSTDAAVQKMEATFDHQAKRFKTIRENILASIGDTVESLMAPVLKVMNGVGVGIGKFIDSLPPNIRKTIVGITGGFGAMIGMAGGIMVLSGAMKILGVSVKGMVLGFIKMIAILLPVTILLGGLGVSVYSLYRAFKKNTGGISTDWTGMTKKVGLAWRGMMELMSGDSVMFSKSLQKELDRTENVGVRGFLHGFENSMRKIGALWEGIVVGFDRGVDRLASSSAMQRMRDAVQGIVNIFSGSGEENDIEILKRWETQGEATGEKLASFGEIALQAAGNILDLTKNFIDFLGNMDVDKVKLTIDSLISTFDGMSFALEKVGVLLRFIWKSIATAVTGVQFLGAALGELMAMFVSGDFSQGMPAAQKYASEFDKIWNPEKYEQKGAMVNMPRPAFTGFNAVQGMRDIQVNSLKDRQQELINFVEKGEKMQRGGKDVSFGDLKKNEQEQVVRAIMELSQKIEKLSNRPINLELDGESIAKSVKNSDEAQGTREFSGAFGF